MLRTICIACFCCLFGINNFAVGQQGLDDLTAVIPSTFVVIKPENSSVEFVGTHVGDDPRPRLGGFKNFQGMVGVDVESTKILSIEITFEIGSIWTEFDNLTAHLMRDDFFDQAKFPQAHFRSTQISNLPNGRCNIKGELTMHGQTAEINFPASFRLNEQGLVLSSQFIIDRTKFGMDKLTDGVEADVTIDFTIGKSDRHWKPEPKKETSSRPSGADATIVKIYLPHMLQY